MGIVRSVAAVLLGYLVFALSAVALFHVSGRDPYAPASTVFMVLTTLYGMVFAGLSGFLAAWISKRWKFEHAFAVACLIAVVGAISAFATLGHGSLWTQVVAVLIIAPMAMVVGYVKVRHSKHLAK
jgi:peptidoglycan/LPS O-acetylase OafA/YrhL